MRGTFRGESRAPAAWTPAALWGLGMAVSVYSAGLSPLLPCVAIALAAWLLLHRDPMTAGLTMLALVPAVDPVTPTWAWIGSGFLAAFACVRLAEDDVVGHSTLATGALQRHMAWCRRREERAHLLVARFEVPVEEILDAFRLTDSVSLGRRGTRTELHALVDDQLFNRTALEQRLRQQDPSATFGWAEFPRDGVALDVLVEHAQAQLDTHGQDLRDRRPYPSTSAVALASPAGQH